jgi:putative hemolysin
MNHWIATSLRSSQRRNDKRVSSRAKRGDPAEAVTHPWHNGGMDFLLIAFLTLLNGVFAMSELALASSRKARLAAMDEAGDKGAQAALKLLEEPTQFLSTVQVGITSIGVLNGIVGEAAFSAGLAQWLVQWGLSTPAASVSATAIVVTLITFTTIIFGELVPKRIGQLYPEAVARVVARPMAWLAKVAGPFVRLLSLSTQGMLKLMRIDSKGSQEVTEEEITASLAEGVSAGLIEEHEHQMVRNVFHLDDRPLTSMMTPRGDIQWLDANLTTPQAMARINQMRVDGNHSWYPVCRENLGHVQGVISVSQLLSLPADDEHTLEHYAQTAHFVPETLTGMELLEQMRDQPSRMMFVVDEYGEVQGLLTPLDLLEAIKDLPAEDKGRYNTLAGLLLYVLGQLPVEGQCIDLGEWLFEIVDLDARRIDKVLATRLA